MDPGHQSPSKAKKSRTDKKKQRKKAAKNTPGDRRERIKTFASASH
jgi:hypothetical protein